MKTLNCAKICFVIFLFNFPSFVFAQFAGCDYKDKEHVQFRNTTTLFVLQSKESFNTSLKQAVTDMWSISKYDFIERKEVDKYVKNPSYSLFLPIDIAVTTTNNYSTGRVSSYTQTYHYYALINGGKKKISNYSYDDMIAYAPFDFYGIEPGKLECEYRLPNILMEVQEAIKIVDEKEIKGGTRKIAEKLIDYYQTKSGDIPQKTLLVNKAYLKDMDEEDFKKVYPFPFRVVDKSEIETAIQSKDSSVLYLLPAVTLNKHIFIVDPANGSILYAETEMTGLTVKKGNVKDIVKAIEKAKKN